MRSSILILVFILTVSAAGLAEEFITVGTFNIQKLGETDMPERLRELAMICRGVDLLAIQEVAEEGQGVEALAAAMGPEYQWAVSPVTTHERFGLIWRPPVVILQPPELMVELDLGRVPYVARFRAGNFDFEVMVFHLFWQGSKKTYPHTRYTELKLLDDWLCHRKSKELDLLLMGDFNEPHNFYGYHGFPPQFTSHYAFYELLNRHAFISVSLEKGMPTSIVNQNIYDHIIFNPSHYFVEEFTGMDDVRIMKWEQAFDANRDGYIEYAEYEKARVSVSDHRPVFAKFRIDLPDDDECEDTENPPGETAR